MLGRVTLLATLFAALASAPADAKCRMSVLSAKILTEGPIAATGGFVVAEVDRDDDADTTETAVQPTWTLEVGGAKSAPKIDTIAPGLVVYRVPKEGEAKLLAGKKVLATATAGATAPAMPAPKVKLITHTKTLGRRSSTFTRAILSAPPPPGAIAMVLADAKGKARSFGLVEENAQVVTVYAHPRCGVVPNDTIESSGGDRVKLFWVDGSGRTSPASKLVTISRQAEDRAE